MALSVNIHGYREYFHEFMIFTFTSHSFTVSGESAGVFMKPRQASAFMKKAVHPFTLGGDGASGPTGTYVRGVDRQRGVAIQCEAHRDRRDRRPDSHVSRDCLQKRFSP